MKHKSILEAVEWHLKRYGSITQLQCLERYASWRLSHYIYVLKKRGLNIESKSLKVKTRFGAVTNVAKYILIK